MADTTSTLSVGAVDEAGTDESASPGAETVAIREKKTFNGTERNYTNLEQQLLVQNIDKVTSYHTANKDLFAYRTFRQIDGDSSSLINKLKGLPDLSIFHKIKTSTLSLLRPKLRIFKVHYAEFKPDANGVISESTVTRLPVPVYKEFKFSDNFGIETAASVQDYLKYEGTKPSWRNVGLESFAMQIYGESQGALEDNMLCKLKLTFKSLKDLTAQPPGEPSPENGGLRYADLIIAPGTRVDAETEVYNPNHYQLKVLVGYTAPTREQLAGLNLTSSEIRELLKIEKYNVMYSIGLSDYTFEIQDDGQVSLTAEYRGWIESSFGSRTANIFQDNFEINERGDYKPSDSVDANWSTDKVYELNPRINSIHKGLNSGPGLDYDAAEALFRRLVANNKAFSDVYVELTRNHKTGGWVKTADGVELKASESAAAAFKWMRNKKNVNKIFARLRQKVGLFETKIFRTFTDNLIEGNPSESNGVGTRLFCAKVDRAEVMKALGILFINDEEEDELNTASVSEQDIIESTTMALNMDTTSFKVGRCSDVQEQSIKVTSDTAERIQKTLQPASSGDDVPDESNDVQNTSIFNSNPDNYKFYYIYAGDVIELACRNAGLEVLPFQAYKMTSAPAPFKKQGYKTNNKADVSYTLADKRILIGPLEYINERGKIKQINLAQFPISFNFFRAWFINTVVRRKYTQMPVLEFLKRFIDEVVIVGMGAGMTDSIKADNSIPYMTPLTLPGKQKSGTVRAHGRDVSFFEELLPVEPRLDTSGALFNLNYYRKINEISSSETMVRTSFDYLLFHIAAHSSDSIKNRTGNPVEDMKDGIYHFSIGSDRGILKKVTFEKVNMPGRLGRLDAESRANNRQSLLQFPFNSDVTLVGAPIFSPGMYYYVNPSLLGLGNPRDASALASDLSLGGYHAVQRVDFSITKDHYETTLRAKRVGGAAKINGG